MNNLLKVMGAWMVAIALIAVPFSLSHAAMKKTSPKSSMSEHYQLMLHNDRSDISLHSHHSQPVTPDSQSTHLNHEGPGCCSGICGGALVVNISHADALFVSSGAVSFGHDAVEPGLWVPPFRPPNT